MPLNRKHRDKVLFIGSELKLRESVNLSLRQAGFEVDMAGDAVQGLEKAYRAYPEMVIMDEEAVQPNTKYLCLLLRQIDKTSIIVLGCGKEALASIQLLEMGADAYMSSPLDTAELVARVHSILRRRSREGPPASPRQLPGVDLTGGGAELGKGRAGLSPADLRFFRQLLAPRRLDSVQETKAVDGSLRFYLTRLQQRLAEDRL